MARFLWISIIMAFSSLFDGTSAYSMETLPDGRRIRVPSRKPPPPIKANKDPIIPRSREPKPKPTRPSRPSDKPNGREHSTIHGSMCGLDTPSKENWEANQDDILEWASNQFEDFLNDDERYENFAQFLRKRWAPNAVNSALFCDGVGQCSISTCLNLVADNHHDKQMALHVFEWIANYDHLYAMMDKLLGDVMNNVLHGSDRLVDEFSSANRIQTAKRRELKKRRLIEVIVAALGLGASGAAGFLPGDPAGLSMGTLRATINLAVNLYVGITGVLREFAEEPDFVGHLKETFKGDMNDVLQGFKKAILFEWNDIIVGDVDFKGHNIVDFMKEHGYLGPDKHLYNNMADHLGRVVVGSAMNTLWEQDRPYFVMVDNPGGCDKEKTIYRRGPTEYLVCLPELPERGFWFYSIDKYHEEDRHEAMVRGPTGFWLLENSSKYFGITLQDVARSSEYVHRKDFIRKMGDKIDVDPLDIDEMMRKGWGKENPDGGRMAGVFTVSICRNPGGEAISCVLDENGQNYPCACGEFAWRHGAPKYRYSIDKDETAVFLARSGFMFSNDWPAWCDHKNHCKEVDDLDTRGELQRLRVAGDPEVPGDIASFFDCKKRRDSRSHPGYPDRDRAQ